MMFTSALVSDERSSVVSSALEISAMAELPFGQENIYREPFALIERMPGVESYLCLTHGIPPNEETVP